ncbi:hypothetical protein ACVWY4_005335 [Bacillus mycoides]
MNNANMPKGRRMVKWTPFAAMPEQFAGISEILSDLNKVPKPIVSEDMKEQIERSLIHSMQSKEEISISFYRDGVIQDMYINVLHIEPMMKTVYCIDAFGLDTEFKLDEIVDVTD